LTSFVPPALTRVSNYTGKGWVAVLPPVHNIVGAAATRAVPSAAAFERVTYRAAGTASSAAAPAAAAVAYASYRTSGTASSAAAPAGSAITAMGYRTSGTAATVAAPAGSAMLAPTGFPYTFPFVFSASTRERVR
jgi:hypothetical protein